MKRFMTTNYYIIINETFLHNWDSKIRLIITT